MSLPLWSKHDAEMYRSLSLFPEKSEGQSLNVDEFRGYFRDLHGRPIQDILEALDFYSQKGYFSYEIMLTPAYLKHGQALAQVTAALNTLHPKSSALPNERNGLSRPVHAKVLAERPLTRTETSRLPDEAKPCLVFMLSDIDRTRLREELAIYNDNSFIQPSRLAKSVQGKSIASSVIDPNKLKVLPASYDKANHVLTLVGVPYAVMKQAGRKNDTTEAKLVSLLFSVKYFNSGVGISHIYPVTDHKNKRHQVKNARALVAAINSKLPEVLKGQELIKFDNTKFYIHPQYKKN